MWACVNCPDSQKYQYYKDNVLPAGSQTASPSPQPQPQPSPSPITLPSPSPSLPPSPNPNGEVITPANSLTDGEYLKLQQCLPSDNQQYK